MDAICQSSCGQLAAGDGWSPRAEDAVLHGCIPVVVKDDVDEVFSTLLDWSTFSIRIAEVGGSQAATGASVLTKAPGAAKVQPLPAFGRRPLTELRFDAGRS